jgi:hypothetical protein
MAASDEVLAADRQPSKKVLKSRAPAQRFRKDEEVLRLLHEEACAFEEHE